MRREIKAMLFADVKNFSKLREEESPLFLPKFMEEVKGVINELPPIFANTWGDGLYFVFNDVGNCADFGVRLLERLDRVDWEAAGAPPDTHIRMAMHAGPVYRAMDPVLGRENFFGSHVNRAARIEPLTTPGCAFVSEQFAALLAAKPSTDLLCVLVGVEQLAKGFDTCPLYWLGRK